jgi:RNA polymerase sigma-70 factor (ECF subfamily)
MIYELFAPKMLALCLRFFKSRDVAEDVLQESFIVVFDKLNQFNESGPLEAWIRKIVLHRCIHESKKESRYLSLSSVPLADNSDVVVQDEILELSKEELIEIIAELPHRCRLVFNLFALEGMPHKEIAGLLGISEGTSKSQLFDARVMLKKRIAESVLKKSHCVA